VTKSRNIRPPRRFWTEAEVELLRRNYASSPTADLAQVFGRSLNQVLAKAHSLGLHKDPAIHAETARQRMADPNHGGRATQFKPGQAPANKGIKHPPGWSPGRIADGQFKRGNKPHTTLPVGSYRLDADGYLQIKVSDDPGSPSKRWHSVHRFVWEAANGPTPAGHVVVFKAGKQTTDLAAITLDAIELISRTELMRRNTRHNYGPGINELIGLRARITRQINKRTEGATP
jgi:hypothetical protein